MSFIKYERQDRIPNWNQNKLSEARVAVIGAGALGNHVCLGLIGLGIGTIKIYDYDIIEDHNLNRQSLFCEEDVGKNKAEALADRLKARNNTLFIVGIEEKIEEETIEDVLQNIDLIIDCVDRIYVRKILNTFCLEKNIPLIHGGISWIGGQCALLTRKTPCINCIFPDELQKLELDQENSCTRKPEASVVYTSQIIAGFMVSLVRKVLLPLPDDPKNDWGLIKLDLRLDPPLFIDHLLRKDNCDCRNILKIVAPEILEEEKIIQNIRETQSKDQIAEFLGIK